MRHVPPIWQRTHTLGSSSDVEHRSSRDKFTAAAEGGGEIPERGGPCPRRCGCPLSMRRTPPPSPPAQSMSAADARRTSRVTSDARSRTSGSRPQPSPLCTLALTIRRAQQTEQKRAADSVQNAPCDRGQVAPLRRRRSPGRLSLLRRGSRRRSSP